MTSLTTVLGGIGSAPGPAPAHALHYGLVVIAVAVVSVVGLAHLRARLEDQAAARQQRQHASLLMATERLVVPTALVSSAAAAGIHAAMGPPHFRDGVLFGLFFVSAAVIQLTWAALLMAHRNKGLLVFGVLGNVAAIGLWAVSRTSGLPFGLLPEPEAVGAWDLACVMWELIVVACCALLLRTRPVGEQLTSWRDWHRSAQVYAGGSLVLLVALGATGA